MKIQQIEIKNFRLLNDVSVSFSSGTTVVVGRNNSGKTSLTEIMHRLFSEKQAVFKLEDFSMCVHDDFWKAFKLALENAADVDVRKALPLIQTKITIQYDKDIASYGPLSDFIVDLNPDAVTAVIDITFELEDGKIETFFEGLTFDSTQDESQQKNAFCKAIKDRVPKYFKAKVNAVDPNDLQNTKTLEWNKLQLVLKAGFINAQRGLDDETYKENDVLGKIVETLFNTAMSESASGEDKKIAQELETAVTEVQANLDENFNSKLKQLIPALAIFGYPGFSDPGLLTETTFDVKRLLLNNTKIRYEGTNGINLPETFNGLGARNLVFILLKLLEFFKSYKACPISPNVHLICIEEPEAHLHPQMQEVFIRQLSDIVKIFSETYNDGVLWPVQFIVSTHSSHIANEAPFEDIRYFVSSKKDQGSNFLSTKIKDLGTGLASISPENLNFLHKYMTLTRCDLLFADKAILVEGTTERLLLPRMIESMEAGEPTKLKLSTQYYSIIEVGGAHAYVFNELLDFLELKTLIITDIDTVGSDRKSSKCSAGVDTSNKTIKDWFGVSNIAPADLLSKAKADKTKLKKYLTYQIPENGGGSCGRSFEASFMLANPEIFILTGLAENAKEDKVWDDTQEIKKAEFAIEYALSESEWKVPLYIKEGLQWLAEGPQNNVAIDQAEEAVPSVPKPTKRLPLNSKKK